MQPKSLQQAITDAGSAMGLLWQPGSPLWTVPVIKPEYVGWKEEQVAWRENVAIMDLSHHMSDLWIEGPDALKLLMDYSANRYDEFQIGQAKQFIPVTREGHLVTDGIIMRDAEERFNLSGVPASQSWVKYHGEKGGYDVDFTADPDSGLRKSGDPMLFRYQIQGPNAMKLVEKVFGGPLPTTKFFYSTPVELQGRHFRAFRHGMAGMPGYEFIGDWEHAQYVKNALLSAGEEFGLVHVGGKAYYTNGVESGWIPTPTPGVFTDTELQGYREWLSVFSYEGKKPLYGSFYSSNIEDYYVSPFELGYGRSITFKRDYYGRDALKAAKKSHARRKVTIELDPKAVGELFGKPLEYVNSYGRYRIEVGGKTVGMTFQTSAIGPLNNVLSLGLVEAEYAQPGTPVTLVWGELGKDPSAANAENDFIHIPAIVQAAPYNQHARTDYRKD